MMEFSTIVISNIWLLSDLFYMGNLSDFCKDGLVLFVFLEKLTQIFCYKEPGNIIICYFFF